VGWGRYPATLARFARGVCLTLTILRDQRGLGGGMRSTECRSSFRAQPVLTLTFRCMHASCINAFEPLMLTTVIQMQTDCQMLVFRGLSCCCCSCWQLKLLLLLRPAAQPLNHTPRSFGFVGGPM